MFSYYLIFKKNRMINLIDIIPTHHSRSMTAKQLANEFNKINKQRLSETQIRKWIKQLRWEWNKIIWNNRWSFITDDPDQIERMTRIIEASKRWFIIWMNKIISIIQA